MTAIVGLDIGYGETKGFAINGKEKHVELSHPSAITKVENGVAETHITYSDETGRYLVGHDAVDFGTPEDPSVDSSYIRSQQYRIMAMFMLNELMPRHIKEDRSKQYRVKIVTGLPMEFYKKDKGDLVEVMRGWSTDKILIDQVIVVPQPLGSLTDVMVGWDGEVLQDFSRRKVLIFDIGHGTVDGIEAINNKMGLKTVGKSWGISQMYADIYSEIKKNPTGSGVKFSDIREVVEEGFYYAGPKKIDCTRLVEAAKKPMIAKIQAVINGQWDKNELYRIIFTGGGANVLEKELPKAFEQGQVIIPDTPTMANARGFAKLGYA